MFAVSDLEVVVVAVARRRRRLDPKDVAEVDAHEVAAVGFEGAEAVNKRMNWYKRRHGQMT